MDALVIALIVMAAVQNISFAAAVGCLACSVMGKRAGDGADSDVAALTTLAALAAPRRVSACLAYVLALTALAVLWLQAAVMSGSSFAEAGSALILVLTQSHYGIAWSVGFAGALLAVLSCLGLAARPAVFCRRAALKTKNVPLDSGKPERRGVGVLFAAGLAAWALGKAMASHAADAGDFLARELVHVVHLCATALWAGGVIVAAVVLKSKQASRATPGQKAVFCGALSALASIALIVVLITGVYNVMQDPAQSRVSLLDTDWGWLLVLKLVCVAVAVALGGWNRLMVLPDLHARSRQNSPDFMAAQNRFNGWLIAEAVVMMVILVIGAVLGHTAATG